MQNIYAKENLVLINKIDIGWSGDDKYLVKDKGENQYILRVGDLSNKSRFQNEFMYITKLYELGISTHKPMKVGDNYVDQKVFQLLEFIKGEQAEIILPKLSRKTQYLAGFDIGKQLRIMHDAFPVSDIKWEEHFNQKIDLYINKYKDCGIKDQVVDQFIEFVNEHRYLLKGRSVCQNHGDFHVGNLVINDKDEAFIIDFNRMKKADPWYEFNRIYFSFRVSPAFAKGQLEGYFHKEVPSEFFLYMKFYLLSTMIATLPWSISFGESDVLFAKEAIKNVFDTYEGLTLVIPKWYQIDN